MGPGDAWLHQLYRALAAEAVSWRQRLDTVLGTVLAAMGGLAALVLGAREVSHWMLLGLGLGLIGVGLLLETKRYRMLHHSRWRAWLVETGYFSPLLRDAPVEDGRLRLLAGDFDHPVATLGRWGAFRARLRRSYLLVLYLLVVSWAAKLLIHPTMARTWDTLFERLSWGGVAGGWTAAAVVLLVVAATVAAASSPGVEALEDWSLATRDRARPPSTATPGRPAGGGDSGPGGRPG